MNKKIALKIKKIINYSDTPEQKRLYNSLKKQYTKLPAKEKSQLIKDLEKTFNHE